MENLLSKLKKCDVNQPYIFISYSSNDAELVQQDVYDLQQKGYNIWLDDKNLKKEKDGWDEQALSVIQSAMCEMLIFYLSKSSMTSENCLAELQQIKNEITLKRHRLQNLPYIVIDAEEIDDLEKFVGMLTESIKKEGKNKNAVDVNQKIDTVMEIYMDYFKSSNKKLRVKCKTVKNRKVDYLSDIENSLPIEARIFEPVNVAVQSRPVLEKTKENEVFAEKKQASSEYYRKAAKRIPQWADKPDQFNHKIVRAFFTAQEMDENVTIAAMERLCSDENSPELYVPKFKGNYDNMKLDTSNSHGKVFEDDGTNVRIWEEVEAVLLQYKDKFMKDRDAEVSNSSSNKEVSFEIYGEHYTGNQSDLMILSIGKVLKHNPQVIDKAIETLTSLSDVDYENNEIEDMPTYFRVCHTAEIAGKTVCIGTSYGLKDKLVQIAKVIALAEENPEVLKIDGLELPKVKIGKNTTKVAGGSGHGTEETYYIFGEKKTGNQSEMMFDYFEELAKRYPDKIAGLTQITSVKVAEDVSNPGTSAASPVYFRVCRQFQVAGVSYYVGTSYGKKDKLVQIRKMQMLCGAAQDSFRMEEEEITASAVVTATKDEKKKYVF